MSSFVTVGSALVTQIAARSNLSAVNVRYGRPRFAEDLHSDSAREAIWLEGPTFATKNYPYLVAGSKPTDETYRMLVVVQVEQAEDGTADTDTAQKLVDTRANALMLEVEAAVAADVTLGLSSPVPLVAAIEGWRRSDPPDQTESYFCRIDIDVLIEARIAAP